MAKKKKGGDCPPCPRGVPEFMLTFGDMNTLLLTFFVLLLTMSTFDIVKFQLVLSSFKDSIGVLDLGTTISEERLMSAGKDMEKLASRYPEFKVIVEIKKILHKLEREGAAEANVTERGVVIQISDEFLFESGSGRLRQEAKPVLVNLARFLNTTVSGRQLRVEGHTDNQRPVAQEFDSNWDLSSTRSVSVVQELETLGVPPDRMSAVGFGSQRPIAGTKTRQNEKQRSQNRRVEIVVLREDIRNL